MSGLIPIEIVSTAKIDSAAIVSARVLKRTGAYRTDEIINISRSNVVRKIVDASGPYIKVSELSIDEIKSMNLTKG